jgi:hypothetical protein
LIAMSDGDEEDDALIDRATDAAQQVLTMGPTPMRSAWTRCGQRLLVRELAWQFGRGEVADDDLARRLSKELAEWGVRWQLVEAPS